jgi:anti-sigma regulatory factor (Ser/Thr protein kinase)
MVVAKRPDRSQIAVLEEGDLVEHYVAHAEDRSIVSSIYLGRVQNVLPGMEAAFVDIGTGRNAVLYAGEVGYDEEVDGPRPRIESMLRSGQPVLVQVTKDPMRHKGARLTTEISLAGRYLVLIPERESLGVSRRLPDEESERLRLIASRIRPKGHGLIVRTAAEGAGEDELQRDVESLLALWQDIHDRAQTVKAPALLYTEPELVIRVVRDLMNADIEKVIVDDPGVLARIKGCGVDVQERHVRVFISYAHDSAAHIKEVRRFWHFLRYHGIDAKLDLSAAESRKGWPVSMERQVKEVDFVLVIASPEYRRRADGSTPGAGLGVQYEAALLRDLLYTERDRLFAKILPVVLPGSSVNDIPKFLHPRAGTWYRIERYSVRGAESLLRTLTGQPGEVEPMLGRRPVLPPHPSPLEEDLLFGETNQQIAAVGELGNGGHTDAILLLVKGFDATLDSELSCRIIWALGKLGTVAARDALRALNPRYEIERLVIQDALEAWREPARNELPIGSRPRDLAVEEALLDLPARSELLALLRTVVADLAARRGFSYDAIDDLRIAVSEAAIVLLDAASPASRLQLRISPSRDGLVVGISTEDRRRVLGPDHPDTLLTRNNLAGWLGEAGRVDEAAGD